MQDHAKKIFSEVLVSVPDAGRVLGIRSRNAAFKAARAGQIPTIQVNDRLMVPVAKLKALLGLSDQVAA